VVGFVITPSYQQNGEIIHLYHSQIQNCYTAYAICQAQSKQCEVKDFESWGNCHTIFDNRNWGIRKGDGAGSPMVDGANIAGYNHQLFDIDNIAFHGSFRNIFAESLFTMGRVGGNAGAQLSDCEIDFQESPIAPSPEYHILAVNTIFQNCILRQYGSTNSRISVFNENDAFIGGEQNGPPLWNGYHYNPAFTKPYIRGIAFYAIGGILNNCDYDSLAWTTTTTIHVNKSNFSGWILSNEPSKVGDIIITSRYLNEFPNVLSGVYPVGYISRISRDTIFLQNTGAYIHDGDKITVYDAQFKKFN